MGDLKMQRFKRDLYLQCDLILRMHYFPEIFHDPELAHKIIWIPNGYKSGIGPRDPAQLRPAYRRRFLSCFLGWLENDGAVGNERVAFAQAVQRCMADILLQPTSAFGQGYKLGMYSVAMEYSVFAPCPAGNSPETIRLYDALELGCIPIYLNHPFLESPLALASAPFPKLNSWDDLPDFLGDYRRRLGSDPDAAMPLQQQCVEWWTNLKAEKSQIIRDRLDQLRREP